MKRYCILLICSLAWASDAGVTRMLDEKLTTSQRNDACFALRGNRSPEVIAALRGALASESVRACAARNLREAGAVDELKSALVAPEPEVRAVAVRELGGFERVDLMPALAKAAHDPTMLVATNAVMALGQYHDPTVLSLLLEVAESGGNASVTALSRAARFDKVATLPLSRKLLSGNDMARKLIAVMIVGDCGDVSDLPRLRELAARSQPLGAPGRGFGLLPALDVARAAQRAIQNISSRSASGNRL